MPTATPDVIADLASELAQADGSPEATSKLIDAAGGDRLKIEAARDQVAAHLHLAVDDWAATAALTLLNRTLADMPRMDPLDWRTRNTRWRRP